jgi:hypothetical protein
MKRAVIFIMLVLSVFILSAEEVVYKTHSVPLPGNAEIIVELDGEIVVNSWHMPEAEVRVENVVSGSVFGLHFNRKARLHYDVAVKKTGATLNIGKKTRGVAFTIGFSTIRERHVHTINLPESARVLILSKTGKITVNGCFKHLDINNREGDSKVRLVRAKIKSMACDTGEGKIVVDETSRGKQFNYAGAGDGIYNLKSDTGKISVYLMN